MDNLDLFKHPFLVAVLPAFIVGAFGYKAYMNSIHLSVQKKYFEKRLFKFYLPVFQKLEPDLYKNISAIQAQEFANFLRMKIDENYILVNDKIIYMLQLLEDELSLQNYNLKSINHYFYKICETIDHDVSFLQRSLGLPTRSFSYRIKNNQMTKKVFFTSRSLWFVLQKLTYILFLITMTIFALVMGLIVLPRIAADFLKSLLNF